MDKMGISPHFISSDSDYSMNTLMSESLTSIDIIPCKGFNRFGGLDDSWKSDIGNWQQPHLNTEILDQMDNK